MIGSTREDASRTLSGLLQVINAMGHCLHVLQLVQALLYSLDKLLKRVDFPI